MDSHLYKNSIHQTIVENFLSMLADQGCYFTLVSDLFLVCQTIRASAAAWRVADDYRRVSYKTMKVEVR